MMINLLQNLGIIGTMSVPWPVNLAGFFSFMEVFTFDIDGLAFACISGAQPVWRYIFTVCFFPVGILWLAFCSAVSRCIPRLQSWDPATRQRIQVKVRSTIGQFLQVVFSTMSSTALVPLVCYSHPSGQRSNFKNPNIICGSEPHTVMVIFGSLLLVFGVCGFLALCAWLAYMCPTFSSTGRYGMVQSSRFLLGRFRLDVWWYGVPLLLRGSLAFGETPWSRRCVWLAEVFSDRGSIAVCSLHLVPARTDSR
ncbi:Bifunctional lysine-specific demethylase and histidyl-hydroxylase NO66 [Durusdinium trenchii]|uniref:Bifunctional lysine-specific demethylase and histidyl-hydroxylase NO66 n=1 Tax=Durusdinium trenchii TaxID=1381693 RepID=A0ABP0S8E3_9DINO